MLKPLELKSFVLPVIFLSILGAFLMFLSEGNIGLGLLPVLSLLFIYGLPHLKKLTKEHILIVWIGLIFFLDDTKMLPWAGLMPLTTVLGRYIFSTPLIHPLANGFDLFSVLFALLIFWQSSSSTRWGWLRMGVFPAMVTGGLIFMVGMYAVVYGVIIRGGNGQDAFLQSRHYHLLPLWTFIGFTLISSKRLMITILKTMTIALVFKGLHGCFVYLTNKAHFDAPEVEYLIDMEISMPMTVAMLFCLFFFFKFGRGVFAKLFYLTGLIPLLAAYILNDRRTTTIGVALFLLCVPFMLSKKHFIVIARFILRWFIPLAAIGAVLLPTLLSYFLYIKTAVDSNTVSFRAMENYNLLLNTFRYPVLGLGFGHEWVEYEFFSWDMFREHILPHNSIFNLWVMAGPMGIAGVGTLFTVLFAKVRQFVRSDSDPQTLFIGLCACLFTIQILLFFYAYMGINYCRTLAVLGLTLGGVFRLVGEKEFSAVKNSRIG